MASTCVLCGAQLSYPHDPNIMSKARQLKNNMTPTTGAPASVRIDKWLWAARFYKTRSLASDAIKTGKIHLDNARVKASRELHVGDRLTIRQDIMEKTVVVKALSDKRGPAPLAALLYEETPQSIEKREAFKLMKASQPALRDRGLGRPTKRERRRIIEFTGKN